MDPNEELGAVLSAQVPIPLRPPHADQALMGDNTVVVQQLSQWQLVWRRFRRHHLAMGGLGILGLLLLLAIIGPAISPENPQDYYYTHVNIPPHWSWRYLLGTDANGHAVIMYILYG